MLLRITSIIVDSISEKQDIFFLTACTYISAFEFRYFFQKRYLLISKNWKTLISFKVESSGFKAPVVRLKQLCKGQMEVIQSKRA